MLNLTRRDFVFTLGAALTMVRLHAKPSFKIGYAAITWNGNDDEAINDIASLGFRGIQLRSNILAQYGTRPAELKALLAKHKLSLVAFSSGSIRVDSANRAAMIDAHVKNARFVHDVGGQNLQLTVDRPARIVTDADYTTAGEMLSEIGKRAAEFGVKIGFHPHMGSLAEKPDELDLVMSAVNSHQVQLLLDVAHYQQGGGDPVAAIKRYRNRLLLLHIKDVRDLPGVGKYQFVELGQGKVNIRAVVNALEEIEFSGWAVVELDSVPDATRTPKESAAMSKQYLASIGIV